MNRLNNSRFQISGIRLSVLFFIFHFSFLVLSAQTKQDLEQKKKKLTKDIEYTRNILNETKKNKEETLNELETLEKQIQSREQLIATINTEMSFIDEQINKNNVKVIALQGELQQLKDEYAKMIYYAYKNRSAYGTLIFIFSAKDFNDAYNRLKYIKRYTEYRKKQADVIQSTSEILKLKLQELDSIKRNKRILLGEEEVEKKTLDTEKNEQSRIVQKLQKKEKGCQ